MSDEGRTSRLDRPRLHLTRAPPAPAAGGTDTDRRPVPKGPYRSPSRTTGRVLQSPILAKTPVAARIPIDRGALADFCRRHHVRKLSLFGSVLGPDFGPGSDVDVLVEFEPRHVPGFLALHDMEEELSRLLDGRAVDLVTERFLNHRLRERVLATAEVQYAAG